MQTCQCAQGHVGNGRAAVKCASKRRKQEVLQVAGWEAEANSPSCQKHLPGGFLSPFMLFLNKIEKKFISLEY